MSAGLYLHIPFCQKRCDYCDFYTMAGRGDLFAPYTTALLHALNTAPLPAGSQADTVDFGGGPPPYAGSCPALHPVGGHPPAVHPRPRCRDHPGGQSHRHHTPDGFHPPGGRLQPHLHGAAVGKPGPAPGPAGRTHTAEKAAEAVQIVRAAGFENLSLDLMLGLPHQTVEEVLRLIRFAAQLGAVHLSAYMLQLEEGTPYAARYTESDIDEETQRQIYLSAIAELERLGYRQYEISNFARPGYESRHNLKYWRCEEYLGLGPAAASCFGGRRFVFPGTSMPFSLQNTPGPSVRTRGKPTPPRSG